MAHDRWRDRWWDDALDWVDAWADECVRRAEETYEPPLHPGPVDDGRGMWPRVDTVWDEMSEDRAVRGLEG